MSKAAILVSLKFDLTRTHNIIVFRTEVFLRQGYIVPIKEPTGLD